ncbi:MAG TPA: hypothetical protein VE964_19340, partial [Myxococcales bacterium]|nr:hypothetical protein [Myxococcales bacterium]
EPGTVEWTRSATAARERVPEEVLRSVREPTPLRGGAFGLLLGTVVGAVVGGAIGHVADQSCPGDCGQPAKTAAGLLAGAFLGALALGLAGAATSSDTVTFR